MSEGFREVRLYRKEVAITLFLCYCIYISILLVQNGRSTALNKLDSPQGCSNGFVPNEKTRSCYKPLPIKVDYQHAFEACFDRDSLLVSIQDEEENKFVANLIEGSSDSGITNSTEEVWIGLIHFENHWRWMYPTPANYMNWAPGMPDKSPRNMVAKMQIGNGNHWLNVNPSTEKIRVVCKKPMGV